ncbi:hypothetical protein [Cohnella soli]|uniref:DksA C4-type domain-containing protein n=1 Tax=Cohnella soli TaxID=425005 RepID=A0ABW0HM39_9BACL
MTKPKMDNNTIPDTIEAMKGYLKSMQGMLDRIRNQGVSSAELAKWIGRYQMTFAQDQNLVALLQSGAHLRRSQKLSFRNEAEEAITRVILPVEKMIEALEWHNAVLQRAAAAGEDKRATCMICDESRHEDDVNMVDFAIDVCLLCEPGYRVELQEDEGGA